MISDEPISGVIIAHVPTRNGAVVTATLNGSVALAGAVAKAAAKSLTGTATVAGTVAKLLAVSKSGSVVAIGAFTRAVSKSLAASLGLSGTVAKNAAAALAGSVHVNGAIAKAVRMALAGSISAGGGSPARKDVSAYLSGLVSVSGLWARAATLTRTLYGAVSFAGQIFKRFTQGGQMALNSTVTVSGVVARMLSRTLTGSIQATGTIITGGGVSLIVVDGQDGETATATVTASLGALVSVYVGRVNGKVGAVSVEFAGSRVGDGDIALTLSKGYWFAYAVTAGQSRSDLYYFAVTDGEDAVATRVRAGVVATCKLVPIPPAENVYEQLFPDEANIQYPCIICTIDGVQETDESTMSTVDDIGRPVKVLICDRSDKYDHDKLPDYELWRQAIIRCFINQQVPGVAESKTCRIEPYVIIDPNLPMFQHMVSGFVVRAVTREPRGVGV